MSGDDLREPENASLVEAPAQPGLPRVLCYVNHYYGPSPGFVGKSQTQSPRRRKAIVERTLAAVRAAIPQAEIHVCGVPDRSLVPVDLPFALEDPRQLVYASLNRMADEVDNYDWFLNLEDDIELLPGVFPNALAFEADSLPNECLLPNRLEGPSGAQECIDMRALPGWTTQQRMFRGHLLRVAVNPHSALMLLSRRKFAYALRHVDRAYRGSVVGGLMASAYAHFHKPLSLYRVYDEPLFHAVVHQDVQQGTVLPGFELDFTAILLSWQRRHNLPAVVDELRSIPQVREVLIWNNDPANPLEVPGANVVQAPRNFRCLPRYGLVPLARYDNIFFQDDDLLVHSHQFGALLTEYAKDQSRIYGLRGRNLRDGRYVFEDVWGDVDVVLGQSMMFHRKLLREAFATLGDLPPMDTCDDIAFSLSCRRKHRAVNAEPLDDQGMSDGASLHLQPGHAARRQEAVDKLLAWAAANPSESELREELEAERVRAAAALAPVRAHAARLEAELAALQEQHAQLAGSLTVRAAGRVKRLPIVYDAYLKAKSLLRP